MTEWTYRAKNGAELKCRIVDMANGQTCASILLPSGTERVSRWDITVEGMLFLQASASSLYMSAPSDVLYLPEWGEVWINCRYKKIYAKSPQYRTSANQEIWQKGLAEDLAQQLSRFLSPIYVLACLGQDSINKPEEER